MKRAGRSLIFSAIEYISPAAVARARTDEPEEWSAGKPSCPSLTKMVTRENGENSDLSLRLSDRTSEKADSTKFAFSEFSEVGRINMRLGE